METKTVHYEIEVNGKPFAKDFTKPVFNIEDDAKAAEEILAALSDPKVLAEWKLTPKDLANRLNYGIDLKLRASVKNEIMTVSAGPDKAIAKAVEGIIKMGKMFGKDISEADALAQVKANAASFGIQL